MAMKVMQKKYNLVNKDTDQTMVVYPEKMLGLNRDNHHKTTKNGYRQRIFKVLDAGGVDLGIFKNTNARPDTRVKSNEVVLYNKNGDYPTTKDNTDSEWILECIPGERARKPRKNPSDQRRPL